jgi:hypothetical protein
MTHNDLYILLIIILFLSVFFIIKSMTRYNKKKLFNKLNKQQTIILEKLLQEGYKIVNCNKIIEKKAETNGKMYYHVYEVPFLVKKGNKKYIVYIKKRNETIRLSTKKDREHFLNLCTIYKVNGVIVLDQDGKKYKNLVFN